MKTLLQISRLKKSYGARLLFEDATVSFLEREKLAVIGRNGAGKSTLFRILTGQEDADAGEVIRSRNLRLAYLEQKDPFQPEETVLGFLQRYSGAEAWRCGKVAGRFALKGADLEKRIGDLPGGRQMRVKLSALLLGEPNLLLLDEPTNYLDLGTLLLLERFLAGYSGAALVISHDREFLKRSTEATLEIDDGGMYYFPGELEDYFEFKEQRREELARQKRNVEARRREIQDFVDRNRAKASKARQAQSRLKMLERLSPIEIKHRTRNVEMKLPATRPRKGRVLSIEALSIGYAERTVAEEISLELSGSVRLAALGDNGAGKTTLLRTLSGLLPPLSGKMRWVDGLRIGYYAQHVYQAINPEASVISAIESMAAPGVSPQQALDMAGAFLFSGDDAKKSVALLSGGERARVALAGLLLGRYDVLLLDEPTNHLDFDTVEALGLALAHYPGAIIFVSHDRTFVSLVATQILEIAGGRAALYPGTYPEYVFAAEQRLAAESEGVEAAAAPAAQAAALRPADNARDGHEMRKAQKQERSRNQKELAELERSIARLEQERAGIHDRLAGGAFSQEENTRLAALNAELEKKESRWLELEGRNVAPDAAKS
ncbi:MAG: ABC-F family ATP-binding cassette domain-containing protein [Leptospirales bacterium]|nr:ABC-F family ATP-binding cassette domain-containing protein [Leptospirales bacterium]